MAHCLRGLLTALGHCDPATVSKSLDSAEKGLRLVARSTSVPGMDARGGILADDKMGWRRERVFAATLRSWSAGRWREVLTHAHLSVEHNRRLTKLTTESWEDDNEGTGCRGVDKYSAYRVLPAW